MDFRQLRCLVVLYEGDHIDRTAERLILSQPALSQQIRQLEQNLDVSLFQRSGRRLLPTVAAHALYNHAVPLLEGLGRAHETIRVFRGQTPRSLAIGVLQTVNASLMPYMVERLHAAQPYLWVQIYELSGTDIKRHLLIGNLDIGIGFLSPRQPDLHSVELYEGELQLVTPEERPLKEFRKVPLAQAAELLMLLLGREFHTRQIWQGQLAAIGRRPRVQAGLNHMSGVLDSLPQTRFAIVLPSKARQVHSNQRLLWKSFSEPRIPLRVSLVYYDAQRQHASAELLHSLLEDMV